MQQKQTIVSRAGALALLLLLLGTAAHAQLTVTLTPDTQFTSVGSPSYFSGTIQNTSSSFVLLNDIIFNLGGQPVTVNTNNTFFANVPGVFAPAGSEGGGDSYTGLIFDATTTQFGSYTASFQLVGDPAGGDTTLLTPLSDPITFTVSNTPEPGSLPLFGLGALCGVVVVRRRERLSRQG